MTASRPLAAASFALLALLLTGCAAGAPAADAGSKGDAKTDAAAPAADQSKEEACELVKTTLTELEGLSSVDTSDPAAALEAFKGAEQTVSETAAQISNTEVKAAAGSAATAMTEYVTYVDGMLADPANADVSAMGDHLTALTEGITELTTVCA
ncbi:hypothetical protein [Agromyces italicus]|uniref:hypothetical protein n=1 Tax=Agromyces italicus TaxID=279572 RepID=UPI0003B31E3B|nr:hypothetical protein [Agromyces italicus]